MFKKIKIKPILHYNMYKNVQGNLADASTSFDCTLFPLAFSMEEEKAAQQNGILWGISL